MTQSDLKKINELNDKIKVLVNKINTIDLILTSKEISCKCTSMQNGSIKFSRRTLPEHYIISTQEICKVLLLDKDVLQKELIALKSEFEKC